MYFYAQAQPWYVSSNVRRSFAKVLGDLVGGMAAGEHHKRASFRIPRVGIKGDEHRVPGRTDDFFTPERTCLRTISSWCVDSAHCTTCRHASCSRLMELFARADSTYSLSHSRPTEDSATAIRTSSYSSAPNVVSVHKSTSGVAPVKPHL